MVDEAVMAERELTSLEACVRFITENNKELVGIDKKLEKLIIRLGEDLKIELKGDVGDLEDRNAGTLHDFKENITNMLSSNKDISNHIGVLESLIFEGIPAEGENRSYEFSDICLNININNILQGYADNLIYLEHSLGRIDSILIYLEGSRPIEGPQKGQGEGPMEARQIIIMDEISRSNDSYSDILNKFNDSLNKLTSIL